MKTRTSTTGERGFTLLELLVTLTIAALMLAVVAPRLSDTVAHARLKTSAVRISTALREARAAARATAQPVSVALDDDGRGYAYGGRRYGLPSGQVVGFVPFKAFDATSESSLAFLPDGSSSGGTLTVARGADRVRIVVDWLTGRVSVVE